MSVSKDHLTTALVLFVILIICTTAQAESVYVINDTTDSQLQAYKAEEPELVFQADYLCQTYFQPGVGAVGLAIDTSDYGDFLFATFEGQNKIELINANTMQYLDTLTASGASNLAGIVADQNKEKLYVVKRTTNQLYVYTWTEDNETLLLDDPNDPNYPDRKYYPLDGLGVYPSPGAFGLALDETNGYLYVTDTTQTIRYYDTTNWQYQGSIDVGRLAVGVAIDPNNG